MKNLNTVKAEMKKQLNLDISKIKIVKREAGKWGFEWIVIHLDKARSTQLGNVFLETDWDKNE